MANGDLFLCTFEQNVGNHPASWTLGFEQTGSTGSVENELASLCALAAAADFSSLFIVSSERSTFEAVKCRKLTGAPNPLAVIKIENQKGNVSGDAIPLVKSCLITHKQQDADVRSNGKTFFPGIAESDVEVDTITDQVVLDGIQGVMDNLLLTNAAIPAGTADFRMVVISYPNGRTQPPVGLVVTSNSVSATLFNSQRRRTKEYGYSEIVI